MLSDEDKMDNTQEFNYFEKLSNFSAENMKMNSVDLPKIKIKLRGKEYEIFATDPLGAIFCSLIELNNKKVDQILNSFKITLKDVKGNIIFPVKENKNGRK